MEPLLGEPSSRSNGYNPPLTRSKAITTGSSYQRAAALVDLAEDGIGLPEEILNQSSFENSVKLYFTYTRFDFLWTLNYFALIVFNFLEKPIWCSKSNQHSCNDRDYYFLGQLPYLTGAESLIFEVITLVLLMVHTLFPISYEGAHIYWKRSINIFKVALLLLLTADILVNVLHLSPVAVNYLPFRIAPYIRVVFFILYIRELSRSVIVLVGMLPTYLNVVALMLLFLLFSSWIAYVMFEDTKQGEEIFTSYGTTLYQMFVLFTTSNNPDVWIPAYKVSRWYSLFFVLYILLGVYFFTNLVLAVVYDSFKTELAKQVAGMDSDRRRILVKAFRLIDTANREYLDEKQCLRLFEELNTYRTLPQMSSEDFGLIFKELDDSGDFQINSEEFADLCHAIALKFSKEDCPSCFESCPGIYYSPFSENLKNFVRSPKIGNIVAVILVINLIAVIIETALDIEDSSAQKLWQIIEFVFGWLYVLEMGLKIYASGFLNYWRDGQNRFDFIITCVIVIGETATFVSPDGQTFLSNGEWIRYLILARVLRLIRLLMRVKRYRAFVATFLTLLPSLMPYLGTIFCVMCIYSSLGVQLFGGIVNAGNPLLEGNDLAENDYFLFNFNDYPNAMVTTFNLLVTGNWQAWMQGYKDLTGTSWSLVYFISFYLITVMLILNLIIAFVLEAFFSELEIEELECEAQATRTRRYTGPKTSSQRVDQLLHRILSSELEKSEAACRALETPSV
ncbi:two pore calcium channel protein 1B-like isoform X2 [Silene latifolia]|uniref:two pore calcium channel protein 1B-like isoform X2 n=1 Tax=Silene latifolia TaxID=37657 RepID=UPI003D789AA2